MSRVRWASLLFAVALAVAALLPGTAGSAERAISDSPEPSNIKVTFTAAGSSGVCVPAAFGLTRTVSSTPEAFTIRIKVANRLCSRINAVAAIYGMPGKGVAWPQQLLETSGFTLRDPGVTEVVFTKTCEPVQFDIITGATPSTISPTGPWHGPLLFPFDTATSLQVWGCGPPPTTTTSTTTTSSTTTTIADNCDDYTPSGVAVSPSAATPGTVLTVTGSGTPGTLIQVILRPAGAAAARAMTLSNPALVQPDGRWTATIEVPTDATPGEWIVAARAVDCDTEVTTDVTIEPGGSTPTTPSTEAPAVAGASTVKPLPDDAVVLNNAVGGPDQGTSVAGTSQSKAAGLAFTGTATHIPVAIGILLVAAGGLLVLRSRRRTV